MWEESSQPSFTKITKMGRDVPSFLLILPLLLLMVMLQSVSSVPLIRAPWGALQGVSMTGIGGRKMDAYLGIPYAVPPVGEKRFEKPLPHPGPGEGEVFVADKIMPPCPQQPMLIGASRKTSEDCLMLDVYVPAEENADSDIKPYAVMAFIHGGGFMTGDAYMYRPTKLVADGKVIVVVLQYRLGVLGFLTSGDDALTDNLGLWDQNLALRWVKDNIKSFGGDPDRITIFGESAGSWSVGLHLIIPQSRGLFNRAIMQSGAPQNLNQIMDYFDKKTIFKGLTDLVGCEGDSSQQRLKCLKQLPVDYLSNKSIEYEATSPLESYYYPVVDGELILRPPRELLQDPAFVKENGVDDIDVIVGFTKDEGGMVVYMESFGMVSAEALYTVDLFREFVNVCFALMGLPANNTVLRKATEFFYLRADFGHDVSQTLDPVSGLYGDCLMTVTTTEWARLLAAAPHSGARYMYVVDHNFVCNEQTLFPGAHHGDDLLLLFDTEMFPEGSVFVTMNKTFLSAEEHSLSDKMVETWTTFARTGNPSGPLTQELGGPWPQFTVEEELYLSVSTSPRLLSKMGPYADRVALWLQLLPQLQAETSKPAPQEAAEGQGSAREEL